MRKNNHNLVYCDKISKRRKHNTSYFFENGEFKGYRNNFEGLSVRIDTNGAKIEKTYTHVHKQFTYPKSIERETFDTLGNLLKVEGYNKFDSSFFLSQLNKYDSSSRLISIHIPETYCNKASLQEFNRSITEPNKLISKVDIKYSQHRESTALDTSIYTYRYLK